MLEVEATVASKSGFGSIRGRGRGASRLIQNGYASQQYNHPQNYDDGYGRYGYRHNVPLRKKTATATTTSSSQLNQ